MAGQAIDESTMDARVDAESGEVNVLDILIVLVKNRRFIVLFTLCFAVLTAVVVLVIPSKYTAEAVILPPSQNSSISSSLLGQLGGSSPLAAMAGSSLGIKSPGDMYVALFQSRTVEDAMVHRFGLMERYHLKNMIDARHALERQAKVSLGTKDGLIRINVTDRDPRFAADMANGYVEEFRKLSSHLAVTEAAQRRLFFQEQLREANDNLTDAEEAMKQTQQKTGMLQLDSQARSLIESAAVLRGQIAAKEVELQAMRSYATAENPQLIVAEQELAGLQAQLTKLAGTNANANPDIIIPKGNIPEAGMEYLHKLRDVKYYEVIDELIAKQFEMAKLDEAKQGAVIQVADVAVPPDKRSFPKRTLTVFVSAIVACFLACGWCFVTRFIERLKQDPMERVRLDTLRSAFR